MEHSQNQSLTSKVHLGFLDPNMAEDVGRSLEEGLAAGAVFDVTGGPDDLFRATVAQSIAAIERADRAALLHRFLTIGPYYDSGEIPAEMRRRHLADGEVAAAIRFIHSSVINSFQGGLAELLAVGPVCQISRRVFPDKPPALFAGDSVFARTSRGRRWAKAADFHLIDIVETELGNEATVAGIAEVKSYHARPDQLRTQLAKHLMRCKLGLRLNKGLVGPKSVRVGRPGLAPTQIVVLPGDWALSREAQFEVHGDRSYLLQNQDLPPDANDLIEKTGRNEWLVTLRWSKEALASVAYEMTFWYMGELWSQLADGSLPSGWEHMTPEEAGQNAAKLMLYYSILRARSVREESRAIALYNSYGFGYALGSNFVDARGRRRELFVEDLREIAATGRSRTVPIEVRNDEGAIERVIPPEKCRIRPGKPRKPKERA